MLRWLPREDATNYDVSITEPVNRSRLKAMRCQHIKRTPFSVMDKMSDNMQVYVGYACVNCGRITSIHKRD